MEAIDKLFDFETVCHVKKFRIKLISSDRKKDIESVAWIFFRGVAQFGSAFGSGPKGREFKSRRPDIFDS